MIPYDSHYVLRGTPELAQARVALQARTPRGSAPAIEACERVVFVTSEQIGIKTERYEDDGYVLNWTAHWAPAHWVACSTGVAGDMERWLKQAHEFTRHPAYEPARSLRSDLTGVYGPSAPRQFVELIDRVAFPGGLVGRYYINVINAVDRFDLALLERLAHLQLAGHETLSYGFVEKYESLPALRDEWYKSRLHPVDFVDRYVQPL